MTVSQWRSILEGSLRLSRDGNWQPALANLDGAIKGAIAERNAEWIGLLARNAGIIAEKSKQLEASASYYRLAFEHQPKDPMVCIALANVLWEQESAEHRKWLQRAKELARMSPNADAEEIIKAWEKEHP